MILIQNSKSSNKTGLIIYRVFIGNCEKVMGNNTAGYQVIQLLLFVLPNVGYSMKKHPQYEINY